MQAHKYVRARPKGSERLITNFEDRFADRLALIVSHVMCLRRIWTLKYKKAYKHYHTTTKSSVHIVLLEEGTSDNWVATVGWIPNLSPIRSHPIEDIYKRL